ncbi:hypothetical protein AWB76_07624 [Caballeronia temeraria]|uniref:Uncharacterized protein n=1 Tax=Caballeronia temeraria TaxID=1777137 RepID=A0A158DWJ0_9BURK|nr:hypothetical protein AWB76_07624 [Caballeronia temeraria]
MDVFRRCRSCKGRFKVRPQSPNQRYCSSHERQLTRRRLWQKERLRSDSDYRENQLRASADWRARNPDYWKSYRQKNPLYVVRNREKQKKRTSDRAGAKMDVWALDSDLRSGTYILTAVSNSLRSKMNAWIVQLTVLKATEGPLADRL